MKRKLLTDGVILSALHMVNDGYVACLPLFLPFITQDINITLSQAGFLGGILHFSGVVLAFPAAFLGTYLGSFHTLGYAAIFIFISYILMFMAKSYVWVLLAFLVGSLGFGVFHPVAFAAVAKTSQTKLGTQMGNFTANGDIGRIALSALLTFMIAKLTWGTTALIYSFLPLAAGLAVLLSGRYRNEVSPADTPDKKAHHSIFVKPTKRLVVLFTAIFTDAFSVASLFLFLPFLFQLHDFQPFEQVLVGNYLGKMVCGRIVELKGVKKVFLIAELLLAITVFSLAFTSNIYLLIGLLIFMGVLSKGTVPVLSTFLADTAKEIKVNIDGIYSLYSVLYNGAETISPLILGIAAAAWGIEKMFIICAGVSFLTFILGIFLQEPGKE